MGTIKVGQIWQGINKEANEGFWLKIESVNGDTIRGFWSNSFINAYNHVEYSKFVGTQDFFTDDMVKLVHVNHSAEEPVKKVVDLWSV